MKRTLILFLILLGIEIHSQEINITNELRAIENGDFESAKIALEKLKLKNSDDPSVFFLEAVLTEDGDKSLDIYQNIIDKYPTSRYADAALYRVYSYYYALGIYRRANMYLNQLKNEHPNSPYLKSNSITQFAQEYEPTNHNNTTTTKNNTNTKTNTNTNPNTNAKKENYSIQVAAFLNQTNAVNLSNQLKSKQYESFITEKEVGGSILKVVFVGSFDNENKANKVLDEIKKEFGLSPKLIKN